MGLIWGNSPKLVLLIHIITYIWNWYFILKSFKYISNNKGNEYWWIWWIWHLSYRENCVCIGACVRALRYCNHEIPFLPTSIIHRRKCTYTRIRIYPCGILILYMQMPSYPIYANAYTSFYILFGKYRFYTSPLAIFNYFWMHPCFILISTNIDYGLIPSLVFPWNVQMCSHKTFT